MITKIAFIGYPSNKTDEAKHFWGELLGLQGTVEHVSDHGSWHEFDAPDKKSIAVDGFTGGIGTPYLALETDNIEAEVKRLQEAGVSIVKDVWDNGVCKMALVNDPEGNVLMLHQVAPDRDC